MSAFASLADLAIRKSLSFSPFKSKGDAIFKATTIQQDSIKIPRWRVTKLS